MVSAFAPPPAPRPPVLGPEQFHAAMRAHTVGTGLNDSFARADCPCAQSHAVLLLAGQRSLGVGDHDLADIVAVTDGDLDYFRPGAREPPPSAAASSIAALSRAGILAGATSMMCGEGCSMRDSWLMAALPPGKTISPPDARFQQRAFLETVHRYEGNSAAAGHADRCSRVQTVGASLNTAILQAKRVGAAPFGVDFGKVAAPLQRLPITFWSSS